MRVALVINPPGDGTFGATARAHAADGSNTPAELQAALRIEWPDAIVRDGIIENDFQRWYVYRDGRWIDENASGVVG
jgi:hypothetical protein